MLKVRLVVASLGFAVLLPMVPALPTQAQSGPVAPLPSQILTAKRVFISNTGSGFDSRVFSGN